MSHGTHMNESWHTYEWVMAHIWMSHGTHMNESCHTYEWVMEHIWMCHIMDKIFGIRSIWLIQMCALTHSYVWHDSFICVPWLILMCDWKRFVGSVLYMSPQIVTNSMWVLTHESRTLYEWSWYIRESLSDDHEFYMSSHKRVTNSTWIITEFTWSLSLAELRTLYESSHTNHELYMNDHGIYMSTQMITISTWVLR